jgi:1,4-alpha-glucan branching enzyme
MVTVKRSYVEFRFFRPSAARVNLVGDFNGWKPDALPMTRQPKGFWRARMRLPAGTFRFRYCADGQWYTDFAAFGVEPGPYGPVGIVYVPSERTSHRREPSCQRETQPVS